jgi:hypothetical protein
MPLQRKTAKPNILLKVAGGNLAAECCCNPEPTPTPSPTPIAKICQFNWVAIYDCDLETFTTLYVVGDPVCTDSCTDTGWSYWQQVGNACWYTRTTCESTCTVDGDCLSVVPTPPGYPPPFSCDCAPS